VVSVIRESMPPERLKDAEVISNVFWIPEDHLPSEQLDLDHPRRHKSRKYQRNIHTSVACGMIGHLQRSGTVRRPPHMRALNRGMI